MLLVAFCNLNNDNFLGLTLLPSWGGGLCQTLTPMLRITVIAVGHQKKSKSDTCYWSIVWFDPVDR